MSTRGWYAECWKGEDRWAGESGSGKLTRPPTAGVFLASVRLSAGPWWGEGAKCYEIVLGVAERMPGRTLVSWGTQPADDVFPCARPTFSPCPPLEG